MLDGSAPHHFFLMPDSSTTKHRAARHFDSPQQEAFLSLWRTYDRLRALEDELFARFELTPQQYNVLRLLRSEHPDALPTLAIAARLVTHAPDITRMLDKLEQRGLIARDRPAENRRIVLIKITEAGITLVKQIDKPLRDCHQRQLGHLNDAQLKQLLQLLQLARAPHEDAESTWK
jgi:DNA-binding MarR family transcriptional regulator